MRATDAKAIVAGDDNHLFFQIGHRLLITRKLTGNFPDYERVLPKDHQFIAKLEKAEIRSAIERVAQFADERSRAIRVQFASGRSARLLLQRGNRRERRERTRRVQRARISRSVSMPNICWISCARFRRIMWRSN